MKKKSSKKITMQINSLANSYMTKTDFKSILNKSPEEINPFLASDSLRFYGSYLDLKKEDKVNALENELVRD